MSEDLKPVRCGCGGEVVVYPSVVNDTFFVQCERCRTMTFLHPTEAEAVTAWNRAMRADLLSTCQDLSSVRETGKWLNLDSLITQQDEIMRANNKTKDKDPEAHLHFATARLVKIFLLKKYAEQQNDILWGQWITDGNGEELCNICWMPRNVAEYEGKCVVCGADMRGDDEYND